MRTYSITARLATLLHVPPVRLVTSTTLMSSKLSALDIVQQALLK